MVNNNSLWFVGWTVLLQLISVNADYSDTTITVVSCYSPLFAIMYIGLYTSTVARYSKHFFPYSLFSRPFPFFFQKTT